MPQERMANQGGLVPSGKSELAKRSSTLVRRGLELLVPVQTRTVRFPPDRSMGELFVRNGSVGEERDYCEWEWFCEARGVVTVPATKELYLVVTTEVTNDLSFLAALAPDDLQALDVGDEVLRFLSGHNQLRELYLIGLCSIGLVGSTERHNQLRELYLISSHTTDAGLAHLRRLAALETLDLSFSEVTDAGLVHLAGMTRLRELWLEETKITDAGLVHLRELSALETLSLSSTPITDAGLMHLRGLTALKSLDLGYTQVTPAGLECLAGLTELHAVSRRETNSWPDLICGELELGRVIDPFGDPGRQ